MDSSHAPAPLGLVVTQIEYSGAFPVSRLRFRDPELPIKVELYAYSAFEICDGRGRRWPPQLPSLSCSLTRSLRRWTRRSCSICPSIKGAVGADNGLRIERQGTGPDAGAMLLYCGDGLGCSYAAGDDPAAIWKAFETQGKIGGSPLQVRHRRSTPQSPRRLCSSRVRARPSTSDSRLVLSKPYARRPARGQLLHQALAQCP